MYRYILWLFWNVVYLFRRPPVSEAGAKKRIDRIRRPGVLFIPYSFRTPTTWVVWLKDSKSYYQERQSMEVFAIKGDNDEIIGFVITDKQLKGGDA